MTEKIYFCQVGDGPIKIGLSLYPRQRISTIRSCNRFPVSCLGIIFDQTRDDELRIHKRFENARIRGEWFTPTHELLEFIAENSNTGCGAINAWMDGE